jgi:hypothetical protein
VIEFHREAAASAAATSVAIGGFVADFFAQDATGPRVHYIVTSANSPEIVTWGEAASLGRARAAFKRWAEKHANARTAMLEFGT